MDGALYNELLDSFGKKAAEEMMMYIIMGYTVDAAIQEVVCRPYEEETGGRYE